MKEKIHFNINQTGEETITCLQLEMLSRMLDHADETSSLSGVLNMSFAYTETLEKFRNDPRCAGLTINAASSSSSVSGGVVPELNGNDPTVGRWLNEVIADVILEKSYSIVLDEVNKCYALLSPTDGMKFADGTAWTGAYGNAMKRFPRVYYHGELNPDTNKWQYLFSLTPIDDNPTHFWEESCIGSYLAATVGGKLCSRPNLTPQASITMSQFDTYAKANGENYGIWHYPDWLKLNALQLSKLGTRDSKKAIGRGLCDGGQGYWPYKTGLTSPLGDGTGEKEVTATMKQCRLFGLEALWGQLWQFVPGIRFDNNGARAVVYEGNIVSNTASGRTFNKLNNASGAYVSAMALGEHFDLIPTAVGGGADDAHGWTAGCWAATDGQLLLVGGASDAGSLCGLACAASNLAFSFSVAHIGSRLAFYGNLSDYELVSGQRIKELNAQA